MKGRSASTELTFRAGAAVNEPHPRETNSGEQAGTIDPNLDYPPCRPSSKSRSTLDSYIYPRLKTARLNILFLHSKHILVNELLNNLKAMGHTVRLIMFREQVSDASAVVNLLLQTIRDFKPDFVLTVNHLGFDAEGLVTGLLQKIHLPAASWFVDSPMLNLHLLASNKSGLCSIFLWDADYIADLKSLGFDRVYYLPLGTDEFQFKPLTGGINRWSGPAGRVGFVGNSMKDAVTDKIRQLKIPRSLLPLLDRIALEFHESKDRRPISLMEDFGLLNLECLRRLSPARVNDVEALVVWRATQIYRRDIIRSLAPLKPIIVGDQAWRDFLNPDDFQIRPPLNYYQELPFFYPACEVNLNITSLQMKNGLNQRVFDVPACGAFLLSDYRAQLEDKFEIGREAVCYREQGEALELARFFLNHDEQRRAVAARACRRVLAEHTYRHRLAEMIKCLKRDY